MSIGEQQIATTYQGLGLQDLRIGTFIVDYREDPLRLFGKIWVFKVFDVDGLTLWIGFCSLDYNQFTTTKTFTKNIGAQLYGKMTNCVPIDINSAIYLGDINSQVRFRPNGDIQFTIAGGDTNASGATLM